LFCCSGGGELGYGGLANCVAIEFDYFFNPVQDDNADRVEVHSVPFGPNSVQQSVALLPGFSYGPIAMKDGLLHRVIIQYSTPAHSPSTLTIVYDGVTILSGNFRLEDYIPLIGGTNAYVGFSSASGAGVSKLDIYSFVTSTQLTASIGGDPHVTTVIGNHFDLPTTLEGASLNLFRSEELDVNVKLASHSSMFVSEVHARFIKEGETYLLEAKSFDKRAAIFLNGTEVRIGSLVPDWMIVSRPSHRDSNALGELFDHQIIEVELMGLMTINGGIYGSSFHSTVFFNLALNDAITERKRKDVRGLLQLTNSNDRSMNDFSEFLLSDARF